MVVPAVLIVSPTELSLRQVGGFLKIKVVVVVSLLPRTVAHNEWVSGGHNKWYQSIPGSTWDHLLIQEHLLLIGGDRVSISDQSWDCLWDRVSISEQRVKIARGIKLVE